jgi:integrase
VRDVGRQIGLIKRGKGYTLRVVVPVDVRPSFTPIWDRENRGRSRHSKDDQLSQVWITLGEADRRKAIEAARLKRVWLDGLFDEARAVATGKGAPSPNGSRVASLDAIRRAVRTYFYELEANAPPVPWDQIDREEALDRAIEDAGAEHTAPVEDYCVQHVANNIADKSMLSFDSQPLLFRKLTEAVKLALDEHASRQVERLSLEPIGRRYPLLADITAGAPPPKTMTLREAVEAYISAPERADRAPKTKRAWRFRLDAWCDLLGPDKAIAAISKPELRTARDTLMALPPNATKRWPGKHLTEVAALAKAERLPVLDPKSVKLYLEALSSLGKWLVNEGELTSNPASGLGAPAGSRDKKPTRRPFAVAELNRLFASGPFVAPLDRTRWRFWVPLIALYHGMRAGEAIGLMAQDVITRDGVPCFILRRNEIRDLKTGHSGRLVPVHPVLVGLGFLSFARARPAEGPLFANLPGDKGPSVDAAEKVLMRWLHGVFPGSDDLKFHGLRHTWADAARDCGMDRETILRIGGWKIVTGTAFDGYGQGKTAAKLAEELAKVRWDGLDLSHLMTTSSATGQSRRSP